MDKQKACALIRAREKQQKRIAKKQKSFVDYDWKKLEESGKLHSLTKPELQHYLKHYNLSCIWRKDNWVQRIVSGPWSEGDEEEDNFIMIPSAEAVTTWSGRVASRVSTVILRILR